MKVANINRVFYSNAKFNTQPQLRRLTPDNNKTDTFYGSKNISNNLPFKGIEDLTETTQNPLPEVEILPNVSDKFVTRISKQIKSFPPEWLARFKDENYKIILAPTFNDAYMSQKVYDPYIKYIETINPEGTLGVTYTEGKGAKSFFVFCDKPPSSYIYMPSVVNHELSHGVINISGADKDPEVLEKINEDIELLLRNKKEYKLTKNELKLLLYYFFDKKSHLPVDEIAADVFAWNQGCGVYGSGVTFGVQNPDLMLRIFPNLSEYLKTIEP